METFVTMVIGILCLLWSATHANVIYRIQTSKTCASSTSGSIITDKTICETQALSLLLPDTTASSIAMSSTFPIGCILKDGQLYIYDSQNTNQCSDTYKCLCKYDAPLCSDGTNQYDCICGEEICTNDNGLVCSNRTCSHPSDCLQNSVNGHICKCGNTDCTPTTGLHCSGSSCSHAPECTNYNGLLPNNDICQCGTIDCLEQYCVSSSSNCHAPCASNFYMNNKFQCTSCDIPGYYCPAGVTQSATSMPCPIGTYSDIVPISTVEQCLSCPEGQYSDRVGVASSTGCNVCPSNMYQDEKGKSNCKGCPNEKIIVDTSTASKHDDVEDCSINIPVCQSVEYLDNHSCHQCSQGYVCDGTSMTTCPMGHFCPGDGTKQPCPPGKYGESEANVKEFTACTNCTRGTFQTLTGQTFCDRTCPIGTYGTTQGASTQSEACDNCPIGHRCSSISIKTPILCPRGTFQNNRRSSTCKQCLHDTYSDTMGSETCKHCDSGLQTSGIGSTSKTQCISIPKTCEDARRPINDTCTDCAPGFYSNGLGTDCMLCPIGFSQPIAMQYDCQLCPQCHLFGSSAETPSFDYVSNVTHIIDKQQSIDDNNLNIIIYLIIAIIVVVLVCLHRCCPSNLKTLDLFFAGEHPIEDTHARRVLETRLGATMSLSMPLLVVGISFFVFTSDNTITTSSLVPVDTIRIDRDFNYLHFEYRSFYANAISSCGNISITTVMSCQQDIIPLQNSCLVNVTCFIDKDVSGNNLIQLQIPDNQQWATLTSFPTAWMSSQQKINTVLTSDKILSGTVSNPTLITFGLTRSIYTYIPSNIAEYGIKLNFRDIQQVDNIQRNIGFHSVTIKMSISESIFVYNSDVKLNFITQLSTVLTLLISVLGSMKTIKLGLEKIIDGCYTKCFKKIPQDIQRRRDILEEHTDTTDTTTDTTDTTTEQNTTVVTIENPSVDTTNVSVGNIRMQKIYTDDNGKKYYFDATNGKSEWVV